MIILSNRQYPMVQAFIDGSEFMTIVDAQRFDQRPFRSLLVRGWVAFKPGRGFHLTREGKNAWYDYHSTEILRKNPSLPLTSYFDVTAYRYKAPPRVQVERRSAA